jgi:hypothetical protein
MYANSLHTLALSEQRSAQNRVRPTAAPTGQSSSARPSGVREKSRDDLEQTYANEILGAK